MGEKERLKQKFINIFTQAINACKDAAQVADNKYIKGRNEAFDDILQWYNEISENGEKLVSVNQIIMHIQEKIEKTKTYLNIDNSNDMIDDNNSDMGRLFSFPEFN